MRMRRSSRQLTFAITLLGATLALAGVSWHQAASEVAPRRALVGAPPGDWPLPAHRVRFPASDGVPLAGWYVPGEGGRAIVLLHPSGGDRRAMADRVPVFRAAGFGVLLYDARASGESGGDKRSFGYYEAADLRGALAYLRARGVTQIVCLGWSQGAATILMAAGNLDHVAAVVLEAGFDTLGNDIDHAFRRRAHLPGWLAGAFFNPLFEHQLGFALDDFRPVDHIRQLDCPALIIGGDHDRSAWVSDTLALFRAARAPKELWLVAGAAHEDLYAFAPQRYGEKVLGFLEKHVQGVIRHAGPDSPPRAVGASSGTSAGLSDSTGPA